jgi:sugar lactone lactonase YvrE
VTGLRCRCRFAWLALATSLLAAPAGAELRVLHAHEAEAAQGAPFPLDAGVVLELGEAKGGRLRWAKQLLALSDAANATFAVDATGTKLVFALEPQAGELLELRSGAFGIASEKRRVRELAGVAARGLAYDVAGDRLFVLEPERGRILVLEWLARRGRPRVAELALPQGLPDLAGLAYDAASGHLHALAATSRELFELTPQGRLLDVRHLPKAAAAARSVVIAPSSDATDDPAQASVFLAAAGGMLELAAAAPPPLSTATEAPLLLSVPTSAFSPPSPDPSGLELLGIDGPLLLGDAEVEEMAIYAGANLFEVALDGSLVGTADTNFFTHEPAGLARNPGNGHLFFSDDVGPRSLYEVDPGADGRVNPGDTVTQVLTSAFGSNDPEGLAYGGGSIWISDGVNAEIYRLSPGANGVFDGVAPAGDDVVASFDTATFGLSDPEGIAWDFDGGHLYVAGEPTNRIAHVSTDGTLLRWLDISGSPAVSPAGLAYGLGPAGSSTRRLYAVDRGVDNDTNPNENDGQLLVFEVTPLTSGNAPPEVSAGPDLAVDITMAVSLDGSVSDEGLPNPPGAITAAWSLVSGPGSVAFADAGALDTTASFPSVGTYLLRLAASDGELSAEDTMAVQVTSTSGQTIVERRVAAGADDAEQATSGKVSVTSSDLDIVTDGSTPLSSVAVRFTNLPIPRGAPILSAWIQFQADEVRLDPAALVIHGEASDAAAPFTTARGGLGARPRTTASVAWSPAPWVETKDSGAAQRTPDLSPLVQEVVSRAGWSNTNPLVFFFTGSGARVAESFEGTAAGAPLLHIVFGGDAGNLGPSVSAGPDRTIDVSQTLVLDGSAVDEGLPDGQLFPFWSEVSGPGTVAIADPSALDTSALFSLPGSYVLRLTVSDGEFVGQDDVLVNVIDPSVPATVERRITAGSDDVEERISNGAMYLTGSDLELGVDGANAQLIGLRFPDLAIPPGANIKAAWIQFMADETGASTASFSVEGEASPNPGTFTSTAGDASGRPRTAAAVAWTPPSWDAVGAAGAAQRTADLSSVVQELVTQPGWATGNSMVFFVTGTGTRTAEPVDGKAAGAPLLHVEYGP